MNYLLMAATTLVGYAVMVGLFDAPSWAAMIGGWVLWLVVRPEAER